MNKLVIPYFTKEALRRANREAQEHDYNRQIRPEVIEALPDTWKAPVSFAMPHVRSFAPPAGAAPDREHTRCRLALPDDDAWLDLPTPTFDQLPRATFEDGKLVAIDYPG